HLEEHVQGGAVAIGDRHRILQVLSNLLGNALRFTPEGGTVSVEAEQTGSEVRFDVHDSGPGIPASDLGSIWQRFWQAARSDEGVGLGLSIARRLVEAQGGRIWVQSRVGAGTTFSFTLPALA